MASSLLQRVVARVARPKCPACRSPIAPEDYDLSQNAVLCRACGQRSAMSGDEAGATAPPLPIQVEVLPPTMARADPPEGTRLDLVRDLDGTRVRRAGGGVGAAGYLGAIGFLTVFNLIWNGVVVGFLYGLTRDFQWFLALFLIPFVIIGLAVLVLWLALLTSPLWRWTWTFAPGMVTSRWSVLGIGRTKMRELSRLSRVELRWMPTGAGRLLHVRGRAAGPPLCLLAFVGPDGGDVVTIQSLTEAEARWLAYELFQDFRRWFVRVGA